MKPKPMINLLIGWLLCAGASFVLAITYVISLSPRIPAGGEATLNIMFGIYYALLATASVCAISSGFRRNLSVGERKNRLFLVFAILLLVLAPGFVAPIR